MPELLIAAGGVGVLAAAAALWLEGSQRIGRRCFAGLVALAVASSVFSFLAGAATGIARTTPSRLTWAFVIALAVLIAVRLYRELRVLPDGPGRSPAGKFPS